MYTCGMHICIHTYARPNIGMSSICFAFLHKTHAHTHTEFHSHKNPWFDRPKLPKARNPLPSRFGPF